MVRPRVDWMAPTDDAVLELLDESGLILSTTIIAINLGYEPNWISTRVTKLEDHGLIERIEEGKFEISDEGRAYLAGDLDEADLSE